jgi:hypothetical protein
MPTTRFSQSYVLADNPTAFDIVRNVSLRRLLARMDSRTDRGRIADCGNWASSSLPYLPPLMNRLSVLAVYESSRGSGAVIQLPNVKIFLAHLSA